MDSTLTQFKSGGTYRLFVDNTVLPDTTAPVQRLLVGQWKQGPVNRAVSISDVNELYDIFGRRDKGLERAGCFAGLIAEQMLASSPIVVLNLREFNDSDTLERVSVSSNVEANDIDASDKKPIPFTSVYDTSNFWKVETLNLLQAYGIDKAQLLNFATVTNKNVTIFIVPTTSTSYNYTIAAVQERYPDMYVPSINCNDLVANYLVDVYMFSNDFSNYEKLAAHSKWGKYFTSGVHEGIRATVEVDGVKMSGPAALALESASGYIGKVTGSLNPDLLDLNGNKLSIEAQINAVSDTTGVVCKINPEIIDMYVEANSDATAVFKRSVDILGTNNVKVEMNEPSLINTGKVSYLGATTTGAQSTVYDISFEKFDDYEYTKEQFNANVFSQLKGVLIPYTADGVPSQTSFYAPKLTLGINDYIVGVDGGPARIISKMTVGQYRVLPTLHTKELPLQADGAPFPKNVRGQWVYPQNVAWGGMEVEYDSSAGAPLDKPLSKYADATPIPMPELDEGVKKQLREENSILKPLVEYVTDTEICINGNLTKTQFNAVDMAGNDIQLDVAGSTENLMSVYRYTPRLINAQAFKAFYLKGCAVRNDQFVNGTAARQTSVLNQLISGGVYRSLMDKTQLSWRYIVDPFKTYIEGNAKYQFAKVCKDSKRAIAFSSLPTKYDLATSTDPYFRASASDPLSAEYMAAGGNTDLPYSKLFSFASQDYGAPYITYIANVRYNDGIDDMTIPATGIVSNAFMRKYTEAGKYPFDIVAGDEWPLSGTGVTDIDMYVSQGQGSDQDYLEPACWNMLKRSDTGNITLLSSRSAQNSFFSAFSFIENIELLIYVADNIEPYLEAKRFKRNTANARLEVKTRADAFMDQILAADGIVSYTNTCDTTNNDEESIARGYIVLDTEIVNAQGITIALQRITLNLQES